MRILFIQNNALDESQALIELGAYLKRHGHVCSLLLDREEQDLVAAARRVEPDLIVIAASMLNHWWARSVAVRLRALAAPIVMGGTAPTLYPKLLEAADVDYIIAGEAEGPVLGLINALSDGAKTGDDLGVAGLYRHGADGWIGDAAAPGVSMTDVPCADKDIYYQRYRFMREFPFKRFLTSRGCHHRCQYCYISKLNKVQPREKGRRWTRRKAPEQAVEEVALEAAKGPLSHVHFSDDLFTNDAGWLAEFAPLYRDRVGIPFTCNTSAELIDEGVAESLADAGCFAIGFAVETASERLRNKVLKKGVKTEHMLAAAGHLRKQGILLATFNMIGLPGETVDEAIETALLNTELGTRFVRLGFAFPMPGTGMCDYAIDNGFMPPDFPQHFASPDYRYKPGPQFPTDEHREFTNLFVMFRALAANSGVLPLVRRALGVPVPRAVQQILTLQGSWNEKRNFRIPVTAGLKFFAKVGRPELRATNFPALI